MIGFIRRLLSPCPHKWTQINCLGSRPSDGSADRYSAFVYVLRCDHCGNIKSVKVRP